MGGDLGSAPIPAPEPAVDHVRGRPEHPLIVLYTDFECPFCAALHGSGVRAGVVTTPTAFLAGRMHAGRGAVDALVALGR